ncbi:hypothetical protein AC249_AIPGENE2557 [Exaiptasia diaphana]|nr:hypothetical protein AC249_AIPGENE2557 [Exaiptasia diaphana]
MCPELIIEAEVIKDQFEQTLNSYSKIHKMINRNSKLDDKKIKELDKEICLFMKLYRTFFPSSSITPKLHFLEDHVMKWVKKYNTGFGLLGEQGIEGIHSEFNNLKRSYNCIRSPVQQLESVLKEHHRKCHPSNIIKTPAIKTRKKKEE